MPDSQFETLPLGGAAGGADGGARRRAQGPAEAVPPPPYSVTIGGGAPRVPPVARGGAGGASRALVVTGAKRARLVETIIARLEEAGRTLLALPRSGYTTALRQSRLDIVRSAGEAYAAEAEGGKTTTRLRPPLPEAGAITRMDEAFGWLALIPADRYVLRRIAGARALMDPLTERHVHSWRRLGTLLGADHRAVQRWHGDAIGLIAAALAAGCALPCAPGGQGSGPSGATMSRKFAPASPRHDGPTP
ncbi:MAG: DUF6362 family protein [Alphaproteobacteria bacterium]|nr:DUF6362 family protein [Alphaproteobacteria bacterium]